MNVSFFLKAQEYALLDESLHTRLVPLLHDDGGATQVGLLEAITQAPVVGMMQPMGDMVLALLISLEQERDLEHYLSEILGERSELLGKVLGERVLYYITSVREIAL